MNYFFQSLKFLINKKSDSFKNKIEILYSCSYERWLEKGFVVIKSMDNKLIKSINTLKNYKDIIINFSDGNAKAKITKYEKNK